MTEKGRKSGKKCSEIMSSNIRSAIASMTLREAAIIMQEGDLGCLPVLDNKKLIGLVTDRDIVIRAVAAGKMPNSPLSDIMTTEIYSVGPDDIVFDALRLMGEKQIRRVPVIKDSGELKGIIAMADIALELDDRREVAETLEDISSGISFWNKSR